MLTHKNPAFTLLESLLTLFVVAFLTLLFSGSVKTSFNSVQEQIFFLQFEQFYKASQSLAVSSGQIVDLQIASDTISNGQQNLTIPAGIVPLEEKMIRFEKDGGNSTLGNIQFQTSHTVVHYQLYLRSGRYKKSEK
ncbi:type II secretion system protein [Streptococcus sp. X16XC17]|nr:type II secretion system protein [Streptococcus sp. X16XC17]